MNTDEPGICVVCNNTGAWPGYPKPCPACGAFLLRTRPSTRTWEPQPRYVVEHATNRRERRAQAKRIKPAPARIQE